MEVLNEASVARRAFWVNHIQGISGHFVNDTTRLNSVLRQEIEEQGPTALLDHLRLCGAIPKSYGHDSSEEKLYSKYTDVLLSEAYNFIGLTSNVLSERADSADVECTYDGLNFVSDAKAFRLSRTAKNQKDFKIQAMDVWKRGKPFAMVVCPIYQLPSNNSQIYEQAAVRNVCIFTYSHLCLLVSFSITEGHERTRELVLKIFQTVKGLHATKDAASYWRPLNKTLLDFSDKMPGLWKTEKIAAAESITVAKEEALQHLSIERNRMLQMSREEAIQELITEHNIDNRIGVINDVLDNRIMTLT